MNLTKQNICNQINQVHKNLQKVNHKLSQLQRISKSFNRSIFFIKSESHNNISLSSIINCHMDEQPPVQQRTHESQQNQSHTNNHPVQTPSVNVQSINFQPPTKNPEQVFCSKPISAKIPQANDPVDDNKSQTSQKSGSSAERKRKSSFISRMSQLQQQQDERVNEKRKADLKSVFLQNVDYKATKQQLQLIFEDCDTIQRITILKDPFTKHPKGCCYISFETEKGVQRALHLSGVTLRNRIIKVHRKRTNLPGQNKMKKEDMGINLLGMMQNFNRSGGGPRGRGRGRGR